MKTIAIIGAGPGLGFSLAKTFGRHGFRIAVVSRTQEKLDQYALELSELGIEARGFAADITNKMELARAYHVVIGALNTARLIIPDMIERGKGALLFTSDLSAMSPTPMFGNSGIVMSGLRNYILNLHQSLHPHGVFVGHLSISPLIKRGTGFDPDQVAEAWYHLYEQREAAEDTYTEGIMQIIN
ncbi:SDR family NAD(P)-dependent oxidoreductase [Paenibacillus ihuae]|uniref:SDR family NAD(P)-dependent oxidoreductase n=1 Tax=Paenibacillus ihuae TaxID=1232431 RepID=UPI0006D53BCA|nr:SDR family NAD(P)-dependent oxidoreductase [Paenibacillus ihuae]